MRLSLNKVEAIAELILRSGTTRELKNTIMNISDKIKELRKEVRLTQVELALRAGVGLRFVRELERGKSTVRMDKVNQVLEFFGYHIRAVRNER